MTKTHWTDLIDTLPAFVATNIVVLACFTATFSALPRIIDDLHGFRLPALPIPIEPEIDDLDWFELQQIPLKNYPVRDYPVSRLSTATG